MPAAGASRRYVIITPCRNEEDHLAHTIRTVTAQTVPPAEWVIVDDGSTDRTPEILAAAAREHPFIRVVSRPYRPNRSVGPGVIQAFYAGLDVVDLDAFDYVCKLDADLELPACYYEKVIKKMEANPRQGNYSGKVYVRLDDGRLVPERMGDENAIGAAKFYRVECFREIGGFVQQVSWDGIDGHMCRLHGWIAGSEDRDELRIVHRRLMGSSEQGIWEGRKRWGRGKYFMGSAPYYVLAVALYRMFERPFVTGGAGILWGYVTAMVSRSERYGDRDYRRFLRRFEMSSLIFGKHRALRKYNVAILAHKTATGRQSVHH